MVFKNSKLFTANHTYPLPLYFPDATRGVTRSLDSQDLSKVGIKGVVVNTYHLRQQPGVELLTKLGGIASLMHWPNLITSDSGGFQLFSLIQKNPDLGKITDEGVVIYTGKSKQKKELFTPEDSIKIQFALGSHLMICLDDFTPDKANEKRVKESVDRTIAWAARCKDEFIRQLKQRGLNNQTKKLERPLLLAPIQGHDNEKLRRYCAQELVKLDFDGYGMGGWPFKANGEFDYDMCELNASLTPDNKLRFALGIGTPANIVRLYSMGYHLFDCVLPTRDARHQRLYVFTQDPNSLDWAELTRKTNNHNWYDYLYINRGVFKDDQQPLSQFCDCPTCQNYSRAYLHHLFKIGDSTAYRLASLHNLRLYSQVMEKLQTIDNKN
jgi:queuine tRNA-ribosyltransferase